MGSKAVRVSQWLGFVSDLLSGEPLRDLPHDLVFDQLSMTFAVDGASYSWSEPGRPPGMITRPAGILDPLGDLLGSWRHGELLQRHPLACWHLTTKEIQPTTIERVPTSIVSIASREPVMRGLRQVGLEQQLSINLSLGSGDYNTYVLGRQGSDFSDNDLLVADQVQRALIGLDRHIAIVRQLRDRGNGQVHPDVGLTSRELCVLGLTAAGHSTRAIAHRLQCSPRTVHKHLEHLYRKLAVRDRLNAVRVARAWGLI
jgi:DNA-binding CsgD family transcriptional regulator